MDRNCTHRVSEFIYEKFIASGKTVEQITDEVGFEKPNVFSMMLEGRVKVPIPRIESLAQALAIDAYALLDLCMGEYLPEAWDAIQRISSTLLLTRNERDLVEKFRQVTEGGDAQALVIDRSAFIAIVAA